MPQRLFSFALLCAVFLSSAIAFAADDPPAASNANPVIEWNKTLLTIVRTPGAQSPTIHSTRNFAILHIAVFEAVNNIDRTFKPYAVRLDHVPRRASTLAAADQAAHDVLVSLYPSFAASLDFELQQDLAPIPSGDDKSDGIEVGQAVATAVLALRKDDGSAATPAPFVPKTQPGDYQLTPPNFAPADFLQWPQVTPFALARASEFRPAPPPLLTTDEYTNSFDEVQSLGFITSTTRTPDQTQIGQFWNGNIQDFWNEIAQTAALARRLDLPQTAHLFAVLNIALADTTIAFFEAKYTYTFWRPVTAIQMADLDGNPATQANPTWLPLPTKTAPDPSYPGAHSAISAAAAEVLRLSVHDTLPFDVTSESLAGITRHFNSFSDAAEEAGLSRIYSGQHFRFDHVAGKQLGRLVGILVVAKISPPRLDRDLDDE